MNFDSLGASGILSSSDVQDLVRQGHNLDQDKTYLLKFAFNDKMNKAVDPIPFQIATNALDKLAGSGIGRPYVHNPGIPGNKGEHVRGPVDDPKSIVEFQKKYAIGLIEQYLKNPDTNNVYFLISAFPEYEDDIISGKIPYSTSPLIEPLDMDGSLIKDGNVLHLQAVTVGGYGQLASKLGVCKGMLDKCTDELKTLGSSGKLKEFQSQFSYSYSTLGGSEMPSDQENQGSITNGPNGTGAVNVNDMVKKHDSMLADHGKQLGAMGDVLKSHTESLGSIGSKLDDIIKSTSDKQDENYGSDGAEGSVGNTPNAKPQASQSQKKDYNSMGSSGQVTIPKAELDKMKNELETIKKERETERQNMALKTREQMAKIIVNGEIVLKEIPADKFQERIKQYVEMVDENKKPIDLSLLASKYQKLGTMGSSGSNVDLSERFPSLETVGASGNHEQQVDTLSVMMEMSD